MNYSDLVQAVQEEDVLYTNQIIEDVRPVLTQYLKTQMNANTDDAEDCVQQSLMNTIQSIKQDAIRNPKLILSYMITTCRNHYLKMCRHEKLDPSRLPHPDAATEAPQLSSLIDEERMKILKSCISQLETGYRDFIQYWFDHPDSKASDVATHFDISVENAWTKKHRVIKMVQHCVKKKLNSIVRKVPATDQ